MSDGFMYLYSSYGPPVIKCLRYENAGVFLEFCKPLGTVLWIVVVVGGGLGRRQELKNLLSKIDNGQKKPRSKWH